MPNNPKAKLLTEADLRREEDAFLQEVKRELHIAGGDWTKNPLATLLADARDRVHIMSYATGPLGTYRSPHGGKKNAEQCAAELLENANTINLLASYGPDPIEETAKRLKGLGVDYDDALERARGVIGRDVDDGRVFTRSRGHAEVTYHRGAAPKGHEMSANELSAMRDHGDAVTKATRMILKDIENGIRADGLPIDHKPKTHAELMNEQRAMIAGYI